MKTSTAVFLVIALLTINACATGALTQNDINPWLKEIAGNTPPAVDITGRWRDAKGNYFMGWGEGFLRQDQDKVSGIIGNYNVKGVVSGKTVYLVFISGGNVYYTARLEMLDKNTLIGNYFEADDKAQVNGYPTAFKKTSESLSEIDFQYVPKEIS